MEKYIEDSYSRKLDKMVSIQEPPYGYDIQKSMSPDQMEEAMEDHTPGFKGK